MFTCKPEGYEAAQRRIDTFWNFEETDRPLLLLTYRKPGYEAFPSKSYATLEERWMDFDYQVAKIAHNMENTVFFADTMPVVMPNLGPEIISAMAGCPYHFGEDTTWTDPCIWDWENDKDKGIIDQNSYYFKKMDEFTRLMIQRAKGSFIVGLSDFHPGGDHVAALRDPQVLATDLYDYPNEVNAKLVSSYEEYFPVFDHFVSLIKDAKMPIASWLPLTTETSMYISSNDFSYMISKEMFDGFFLDGLIEECRHYQKSIHHLDGIGCLRHLDSILSVPNINAIQWVPGSGKEQVTPWIDVFKKIIGAGKSVIAYPGSKKEVQLLMDHLPAQGLCLQMSASNREEAEDILNFVEQWPIKKWGHPK